MLKSTTDSIFCCYVAPSLFDTSLREFDSQIEYCNSPVTPPSLETTYTALHLLSKFIAFLIASAFAIKFHNHACGKYEHLLKSFEVSKFFYILFFTQHHRQGQDNIFIIQTKGHHIQQTKISRVVQQE